MKRLLTVALAAALTFGSFTAPAFADVTQQVEKLSGDAANAYRDGDYKKAVELFQKAYALQKVPNLLFNIAKVYEKMKDPDNAMKFYREFIKAPDADPNARDIALQRIDALEAAKREAEEKKKAEEQKKLAEQQKQQQQQQQQQQKPTPPPAKPKHTGAWIALGASGAVLAGGAVFGLLARAQQTKFQDGATADDRRAARKKGLTYAVVADSMFGAGIVAGVVGVILLATGGSETPPPEHASLPYGWVGPHGAGLGMTWRF